MLSLIILFITGIFVMFSSLIESKHIHRFIALSGVVLAITSVFMKVHFSMESFVLFYNSSYLNILMTLLTLVVLFFIILNSRERESQKEATVFSLMLFSSCGALLLYGANNLLTIFLGIEILSIPLYVMASSDRENSFSLESGLKYFILGAFASAFMLFGIAMIYGSTGTFQLNAINNIKSMEEFSIPTFYIVGMIMLIASIGFKMSLVPFHSWSPDVYEGSPTIVTTYMATIVKIAATMSMFILLNGFFSLESDMWLKIIYFIAAISLILSSTMGLVQYNVKRILAYSSITHAAFLLLAIVVSKLFENSFSITIYLVTYVISSLLVFLILNAIEDEELHLDVLNGFAKKNFIYSLGLFIGVLSMIGIPLTGGFIAKYNVLVNVFVSNKMIFFIALLSSIIAIGFYLKIINRIFLHRPVDGSLEIKSSSLSLSLSILFLSLLIILLGIFPNHIIKIFETIFL